MRLGNGAINCAGQGHNEHIAGVDITHLVCITLCQNELTTGVITTSADECGQQYPGNPATFDRTVINHPRVASPRARSVEPTTTLPSYYSP